MGHRSIRDDAGGFLHEEVDANLAAGKPFAVRLKIEDHPLRFHDLVRGEVEFAPEAVSDPIIVRSATTAEGGESEGIPVYNYVVTIDDALMDITHVIRGDDHISNTPKQVAIYEAFGWEVPQFAHLSTILGADRERLSKRHGATSISTFREMGYLPEALVNYLALLGWGAEDGKTETFTLDELTGAFSLERVTPSPAIFDFDKLNWLNRHYLKQADRARLAALAWPYFDKLPSRDTCPEPMKKWFDGLLAVFVPHVDHLDQLPEKAAPVIRFDCDAARDNPENAAILEADSSRTVLGEFAARMRTYLAAHRAGSLQGVDERDQGGHRHQGQGAFSSRTHCAHRLPLGTGLRQDSAAHRRGIDAGAGDSRCARAGRVLRGSVKHSVGYFLDRRKSSTGSGDRRAAARHGMARR